MPFYIPSRRFASAETLIPQMKHIETRITLGWAARLGRKIRISPWFLKRSSQRCLVSNIQSSRVVCSTLASRRWLRLSRTLGGLASSRVSRRQRNACNAVLRVVNAANAARNTSSTKSQLCTGHRVSCRTVHAATPMSLGGVI